MPNATKKKTALIRKALPPVINTYVTYYCEVNKNKKNYRCSNIFIFISTNLKSHDQ